MKLKTLKDLPIADFHSESIDIEVLKQEAIKWWKHYGGAISSRDWLDFFNISEEDLK